MIYGFIWMEMEDDGVVGVVCGDYCRLGIEWEMELNIGVGLVLISFGLSWK